MKSYLSLAWKELKTQRVTSILILLAIILSTVMTTVVGQSIGILQSMRINQAASLNGDRYVTFHQLSEEQTQYLSEDTRLTSVGSLGNAALQNSGLTLYLREYCGNALDAYPAISEIKEGRLPERENEIALSENTLQYLEFNGEIGDTIHIPLEVSLRNDMEAAYEKPLTKRVKSMDFEFIDNSDEVMERIRRGIIAGLEAAAGELESQAAQNTPVDTGQLKSAWGHIVDENKLEATVGNTLENAIWTEFGTGEHALNNDGRKGGWFYVDAKGKGHFTHGKKPIRMLFNAFTTKRNVLIRIIEEEIKSALK